MNRGLILDANILLRAVFGRRVTRLTFVSRRPGATFP